jgi:hypothetical protein
MSLGACALSAAGTPTTTTAVLHIHFIRVSPPAVSICFHDPDGHLLEYIAMLAEDPRPDGGIVTWNEWNIPNL